jgi:hypothetical protein
MAKEVVYGNTRHGRQTFYCCLISYVLCSVFCVLCAAFAHAEVLERIVAIVNDDVILLSEFKEAFRSVEESGEKISEKGFLDEMINNLLLLKEAKKFSFYISNKSDKAVMDEKAIINEYIDRRIKVFIRIPYDEIESYYSENKALFEGKEFYDAKDEIEEYLIGKELNIRVNEYIKDLRKKHYIRIQLKTED